MKVEWEKTSQSLSTTACSPFPPLTLFHLGSRPSVHDTVEGSKGRGIKSAEDVLLEKSQTLTAMIVRSFTIWWWQHPVVGLIPEAVGVGLRGFEVKVMLE